MLSSVHVYVYTYKESHIHSQQKLNYLRPEGNFLNW